MIRALTLSAGLLGCLYAPAMAQTPDEVIVTATKLDRDISDLPLNVSVIGGESLESYDGGEELTRQVAGLQASVGSNGKTTFQIRGIGAVDHQPLTPTAAAVYMDGVYLATIVQTGPLLFDVEKAEILRGPQGTLYGRNASSGAINFISRKPRFDGGGYLQAEAGNFDRVNLSGAANIPMSEDFAFRLSGRFLTQGPTLENVQTNPDIPAPSLAGGEREEFAFRLQSRYQPSTNTDINARIHYAEDNGYFAHPLNDSHDLDKFQISIGPDGLQQNGNEFYGASVDVAHQWGGINLDSLTAVEVFNQQIGYDFDGSPAPFGDPTLNANLSHDRDFVQISHESRLSKDFGWLDAMAGVHLSSEDFDQVYSIWCGELDPQTRLGSCSYVGAPGRTGSNPASDGTVFTLVTEHAQTRETAALFSYNSVDLPSYFQLDIGARLSFENIKGSGRGLHIFDDGIIALNNRNDLGPATGENQIKDTRLSGNASLSYRPDGPWMIYAGWSNGYKSGGFDGEVINNATRFSDEGLFDPETVNAFEMGIKFGTRSLRFNTAAFYQLYDNPQARIFVPFSLDDGGSFTSNALSNLDEATSYGAEAQFEWQPSEALSLRGGATWLETEINQAFDPDVPQNAEDFDGNPLPLASKFSIVLAADYVAPISESVSAIFGVNGKYQSSFYLDAEGLEERRQPGYEIIDARAALRFGQNVELGVWGRNLTDTDYATSGFGFIGYNTFRSTPRSYGISAKYSY